MRTKRYGRRRLVVFPALLIFTVVAGALVTMWLFGFIPGGATTPVLPNRDDTPTQEQQGKQSGKPEPTSQQEPQNETPATAPDGLGDGEDSPSPETPEVAPPIAQSGEGFMRFYYAEADRADEYARYASENPQLSDDEVVWQVNAGLGGVQYEDYVTVRDTSTTHYIVNKHHRLPDSFEPDELVSVGGAYKATPEAAEAYYKMQADARAEGYVFSAISAYRSIESQRNLYNGYLKNDPQEVVDTYSARPGFSEHHTGRAIDLAGSSGGLLNFVNTPECAWVHQNAYKYGFILRYPDGYEHITGYSYEPWHITYVGESVAAGMRSSGIKTLEEYAVKYIEHKQ